MATIKERAYNAYPTFTAENADQVATARSGYIKGATDQRKIDIENACSAYCRCCDTKECFEEGTCDLVDKFRRSLTYGSR